MRTLLLGTTLTAWLPGCGAEVPAEGDGGSVPMDAPATGDAELGAPCTTGTDCASGLCAATSADRGICTATCNDVTECPASWSCVLPSGGGIDRVCACTIRGAEDCTNELDDDCNGRVDDCRVCGGVAVPASSREHCGACDHACRADQDCVLDACVCAGSAEIDCAGECADTRSDPAHCGACGRACAEGASCVAGECTCPSTRPSLCGDACVDLDSDPAHCGGCDRACAPGLSCIDGECACEGVGRAQCAPDGCVDLRFDPRHCGSCDRACAPAERCFDGTCGCDRAGERVCGDRCVDALSDPENCGACGVTCGAGERCQAGACRCDSGLVCGGRCVSRYDAANCGACGVACRADQSCTGTSCACTLGGVDCGGRCVDTGSDPRNCGGCGIACGVAQSCVTGRCTCPTGQTFCDAIGACVDLRSDRGNCGACGNVCPDAQTCSSSACRCPISGQTYCAAAGRCVDLQSDPQSCGACGVACAADQQCRYGRCECAISGGVWCAASGSCTDPATDEANCGGCGIACPPATTCSARRCTCDAAGATLCGTRCVDLQTDRTACGSCSRTCTAAETCSAGACTCPAPRSLDLVRLTNTVDRSISPWAAVDPTGVIGVAWSERVGVSASAIMFVRLGADGRPLAPPIELHRTTSYDRNPRVAYGGGEWAVAWNEDGTVRVQRVAADGTAAGAQWVLTGPGSFPSPASARITYSAATGWIVAYRQSGDAYVQIVGRAGDTPQLPVLIASRPSLSWSELEIAAAPDGRILVVHAAGVTGRVAQRVNADGSVTTPAIPLSLDMLGALVHDGTTWLLAGHRRVYSPSRSWSEAVVLRGESLERVTALEEVTSYDAATISVHGDRALLAWHGRIDDVYHRGGELRTARIRLPTSATAAATLESRPQFVLVERTVVSTPVAVLAGSDRASFVWEDNRWGHGEIYVLSGEVAPCP